MLTPRKPDGERARPNKYKNRPDKNQLPEWDGKIRGPELPLDTVWSNRTRDWWSVWRRSPQAMLCAPTDWQAMLVAAELHNRMFMAYEGSFPSNTAIVNLSAEVRKIVGSIGGSFEDRESLGMSVRTDVDAHEEVTPVAEGVVHEVVDYMAKLTERQKDAQKGRLNGTS